MKKLFLWVIAALFIGGCSTLEVQVDYDNEHNFSTYSTFAVVYKNKDDGKDFDRDRIGRLASSYMKSKGYLDTDKSAADFYVTMHLDVVQKSQVETNYETIGIRPVPYTYLGATRPYPLRPSGMIAMEPDVRVVTRTDEYEEAKLILEILDVKENRVVWQGVAKDRLSERYNQQEKSDYLNNVISELFKDFPTKK